MEEDLIPEDDSIFEAVINESVDISSDELVEDSFSSVIASTPQKDQQASRGRGRGRGARRLQPAPSTSHSVSGPAHEVVARPKSRLKCLECLSTFANERTLSVHRKKHSLKRAFANAATTQEFGDKIPQLLNEALDRMLKEPCIGAFASKIHDFTLCVKSALSNAEDAEEHLFTFLSQKLYSILSDHSSVFSSALVFTLHVGVNKLITSIEFRDELKQHLNGLPDCVCSEEEMNCFMGGFMLQLTYVVLVYYIHKIHGGISNDEERRKRSKDDVDSQNFQELVYHIGGSVVNGLLYKGQRFKDNNNDWKAFVDILNTKFRAVESVGNACSERVRGFSEGLDRGGYKHISQEAMDFFLVVFNEIMSLEGKDGSLPEDLIDNHILKNDIIVCLWDVLIGNELDEEPSIDFLIQTSETCKKIVVKGIIKRILSEEMKKPVSSVPLRSRLAK